MTDHQNYKNEFSRICDGAVKCAENGYSLFSSPSSDFSKQVVLYYSFSCSLMNSIQEIDSLMLKLSADIQAEDMADRHQQVAVLHRLFEHCAIHRKNIEDFLSSTELAKSNEGSFWSVLRSQTDILMRKTLILKNSAISIDLL